MFPARITDLSDDAPENSIGEPLAVLDEGARSRRNSFRIHEDWDDQIHHGAVLQGGTLESSIGSP
jgi:hypothetical protein